MQETARAKFGTYPSAIFRPLMAKATTPLAGPLLPSAPCPPLGQRPPIRCLRPIRPILDGTAKRSRVSRAWLHRKVADEPQLVPRGNLDRLGSGASLVYA